MSTSLLGDWVPFESMRTKESIFISYHRSDTEGYAGRLADALTAYFGRGRVFRDVGSIAAGENFEDKLHSTISEAEVVIVLIGPNWLAPDKNGKPRIFDPEDHLANEILNAMSKSQRVIPVLVQNARMPLESELPESLRDFVRCNAVSLTDEAWQYDLVRLAKILSLDMAGSINEKQLRWIQRVVLVGFTIPLTVGIVSLGWDDEITLVTVGNVALPMLLIAFVLSVTITRIHIRKRIWILLAVITVIVGLSITYQQIVFPDSDSLQEELPKAVARLCITIVIALAFAGLSGFKPSDKVD